MDNIELINFVDLTLEERIMILEWRNEPKIREWMYNQAEITVEEHFNFIESLKMEKDKLYFLVKKDNCCIGVVDFTQIILSKSLYMGIYTNPYLQKEGKGKLLLETIIDFSFVILKVKKIYSEVFFENIKAYNLYEKYKFKKISEKIVNSKKVICMELKNEDR